jgi:hypothetical protein
MSVEINSMNIGGWREEGHRPAKEKRREEVEIGGWTKYMENFMLSKINAVDIGELMHCENTKMDALKSTIIKLM